MCFLDKHDIIHEIQSSVSTIVVWEAGQLHKMIGNLKTTAKCSFLSAHKLLCYRKRRGRFFPTVASSRQFHVESER